MKLRLCCAVGVVVLGAAFALAWAASKVAYPETKKVPVTDTVQGVKIEDDYQWLENGKDPKVQAER